MKLQIVLLLTLALAAVGCQKKNEDGSAMSPTGTLPGQGSTVSKVYSGSVAVLDSSVCLQDCKQTVTVNANVIDYPSDAVSVYLCRNADCSVSIPSVSCASVATNPTAACFTTTPNPDIVYGKNTVVLVNAFKSYCVDSGCTIKVPGYSSYTIQTTVTR